MGIANFTLPKPRGDDDWELFCKRIFAKVCGVDLQRFRRRGQDQKGIDLLGTEPDGTAVSIQCKRRSTEKELSEKEAAADLKAARSLDVTLKSFIIATTHSANNLQEWAARETKKNAKKGLFDVRVYSWNDIEDLIASDEALRRDVYGTADLDAIRRMVTEAHGQFLAEQRSLARNIDAGVEQCRVADAKTHAELAEIRKLVAGLHPQGAQAMAGTELAAKNEALTRDLEAAFRRIKELEEGGSVSAARAIEEIKATGDAERMDELLEGEALKRVAAVRSGAMEYVAICREQLALAIVRGDCARAEAKAREVLKFLPDDFAAQIMLGDVYRIRGNLTSARELFELARRRVLEITALDPQNTMWQGNLSLLYQRIGDLLMVSEDLGAALVVYRDSLATSMKLVARNPESTSWQRSLSIGHEKIGDVLMAMGEAMPALEAYRSAMATCRALAAREPQNLDWQQDLAIIHTKLGDALAHTNGLSVALEEYRAGLAIRESRVSVDPRNLEWQRDLAVSHNKVGDVLLGSRDHTGALSAYRAGMMIAERLAAHDRQNTEWQRDLSVSYNKVGDAFIANHDLPGALASYRSGREIIEKLAAGGPGNTLWQRDLSFSHEKVGSVLQFMGNKDGALEAYRASMTIREKLVLRDPKNTEWQFDVAWICGRVASCLEDDAEAGKLAERGRAIMWDLIVRYPPNARWNWLHTQFEAMVP